MTTQAVEIILGRELRLSLEGCSASWLNNEQAVIDSVEQICRYLRVEIRSLTTHKFEPQGVSVVAILTESHCAIHTWPETGSATVDIFTCGEVDPLDTVPAVTRMASARSSRLEVSTRDAATAPDSASYPGYPEYILRETPFGHFPRPQFRRGVGREYIMEAEAVSWQKFFTGPDYAPPLGKDILLLHPCSWAKPYDMSSFVTNLRAVTDKFDRIHRAVVSNVGVVPFEYQMNPYFCSYDYNHVGPELPKDVADSHTEVFRSITAQRIEEYIQAHSNKYKAVVILGHPTRFGYQAAVQRASLSASLPGFRAPSVEVYQQARIDTRHHRDIDASLFADVSLQDLELSLRKLIAHIENARPYESEQE